jgi:hypothetical protein
MRSKKCPLFDKMSANGIRVPIIEFSIRAHIFSLYSIMSPAIRLNIIKIITDIGRNLSNYMKCHVCNYSAVLLYKVII